MTNSAAPPLVVFAGKASSRPEWEAALLAAAAASDQPITLLMDPDDADPADVSYVLFAPSGPVADLRTYPKLRAVLSLWAGVEEILPRPDLPEHAPVVRMVEPGLTDGMVEYVVGHAFRAHLEMPTQVAAQAAGEWRDAAPPLAPERRVGVIGLGVLGQACAEALAGFGFQVSGWSRTPKDIARVASLTGEDGLRQLLRQSDIVTLLAPETPETVGLMNAARFAEMPDGAHLINAARGPLVVEGDLIAALDAPGGIAGAVLDVFDVEPLPADHPFWSHPKIMITPHIASITRPKTAAIEILRQIARDQSGLALSNVVNREQGY